MTLLPYRSDDPLNDNWQTLSVGAPMIIGFAQLCARALLRDPSNELPGLTAPAKTLLFAARDHGVFELKVVKDAFASADRFLSVYVETSPEEWLACRVPGDPQSNAAFLDGFRQLCAGGLVIHHSSAEFSLSSAGFEQAGKIAHADVAEEMQRLESL